MTSILAEADNIAGEDRSRDYGHPLINHQRIAAIWNVQLAGILTAPITPRQVAFMMIGVKLAREANTPKRDNLVDIAGYVKCIDMIDTETPELSADKKQRLQSTHRPRIENGLFDDHEQTVIHAISLNPCGETFTAIRDSCDMSSTTYGPIQEKLLLDGTIKKCLVEKNGRIYPGVTLASRDM